MVAKKNSIILFFLSNTFSPRMIGIRLEKELRLQHTDSPVQIVRINQKGKFVRVCSCSYFLQYPGFSLMVPWFPGADSEKGLLIGSHNLIVLSIELDAMTQEYDRYVKERMLSLCPLITLAGYICQGGLLSQSSCRSFQIFHINISAKLSL